nr:hypothetical protein [Gloeothece citriformis]
MGFYASVVPSLELLPVYRFYNTIAGGHFFTISEAERNFVQANLPQYVFEEIGFYSYGADANLGADVYRFYNTIAGGHFFTISPTERDNVINTFPQFIFEGVGFEAGA